MWVVDEVGTVVSQGVLLMPQRGDWANWGDSSFVPASLTAGQAYTVIIEKKVLKAKHYLNAIYHAVDEHYEVNHYNDNVQVKRGD